MKWYRCLCLVLCCCVLSSIVFSLDVNAKESVGYSVVHSQSIKEGSTTLYDYTMTVNPDDNVQNFLELQSGTLAYNKTYKYEFSYEVIFDDPPVFVKDRLATIGLYDAYFGIGLFSHSTQSFSYLRDYDSIGVLVTYTDKSEEYFTQKTHVRNGPLLSITCEFAPKKDVRKVKFIFTKTINGDYGYDITWYLGEVQGVDSGYSVDVSQQSEESGFLSGILGKLTEFKDNVAEKFNNLITGITELPQKIWEKISDGLKSLFIPSQEFIVQFKDDLDSMLEEKLGAVYQVIDITVNSWDKIQNSDATDTIEFPEVSITLLGGENFSFGGYDVKIVPNGFEFIVDSIKLICGIVATLLFVNGLRKRYDEVMGVEQ